MASILSNKNTKSCSRCLTVKPLESFFRDKAQITGRMSACKECMKVPSIQKMSSPLAGMSENSKTSLNFLLDIKRFSKTGWTYEQALHLLMGIQKASQAGMVDFKYVFTKFGSGKAHSTCNSMVKELKQAAEKGISLEEYFRQGRPFKEVAPSQKVILGSSKKK